MYPQLVSPGSKADGAEMGTIRWPGSRGSSWTCLVDGLLAAVDGMTAISADDPESLPPLVLRCDSVDHQQSSPHQSPPYQPSDGEEWMVLMIYMVGDKKKNFWFEMVGVLDVAMELQQSRAWTCTIPKIN